MQVLRPYSENDLFAIWRFSVLNRGEFDVCLHKESGRWTVAGKGCTALMPTAFESDEERQQRIVDFVRESGLEFTDGGLAVEPEPAMDMGM
ncbi:hypothetical protein ACVIGB_000033 [Bradyrhizobium sp. USDA 4341]